MMSGGQSSSASFFCSHLLLLVLVASASQAISREGGSSSDHAPGHESTPVHHPAASLAIVGSLEDVKMKSSIAQLVKALQTSKPKVDEDQGRRAKLELVTKNGPMKIEHHSMGVTGGRKLDYGEEASSPSIVPEPIVVSSQAIRIGSNGTGGRRNSKQGRSLVDTLTGVRTIEGVRVPDDEADKHYTWRNARVIKGFLVPNDRSPNPHKKRQTSGPVLHQQQSEQVLPYAQQVQQQQQQQQKPLYVYSDLTSQPQSSSVAQRSDTQQQQQLLAQAQAAVQALQQPQQQTQQTQSHLTQELLQAVLQQAGAVPSGGASYIQFEQPTQQGAGIDRQVQLQQQQYLLQQQQQQQQLLLQQQQAQFAQRQGQAVYPQQTNPQQQQQVQQPEFLVQQQTYTTGPGGQTFTVPIPVPADQVVQQTQHQQHILQQQQQQQQQQYFLQAQHQQQQHQQQQGQRNPQRPAQTTPLAKRVMAALHQNQKNLERMDTATAVVPALASTGIFLGLSALAAGWYLSKSNREVGIVKRTGKPSRAKRDLPPGFPPGMAQPVGANPQSQQEVDQATFFQSIIQQSLEKTQQQYEDEQPIVYQQQQSQPEPVYQQQEARPKSERRRPGGGNKRHDEDDYPPPSRTKYAQEKVGALTIGSSKNFAKVFVPAFILGLSVVSITALIFGWYITGANREIAFLEPASYSRSSREKRSLALSEDGWLQRVIKAIHGNPYDRLPAPTSKSLLPHPFLDSETSKTSSSTEFAISNAGITGVLAGGAIIALVALGLANSFSETARKNSRATAGARFQPHHRSSAGRSLTNNSLLDDETDNTQDPGWIAGLLTSMEAAGQAAQDSPCFKMALCTLISQQDEDTLKALEKRMAVILPLLPQGVSSNLKEVLTSIYSKNCSVFKCTRSRSTNATTPKTSSR